MTAKSSPERQTRIFGFPLESFGLFSSLLLAFSSGFFAFFLTTTISIFVLLFYNTAGGHHVDYAIAYKRIAFPVGLVVLAVALVFFGSLWLRAKFRAK